MMLPRGASHPADYDAGSDIHADVRAQARASVDALYRLMEAGIRPRDIMTERAFENAITTVYAMGGSTNMYLHLLAVAREAQVPITIERIQQIGERVPLLANLQPHGPYRDGQPACDRRRAGRDEGTAARRPAAWRRHDGHRQDAGGKSRRRFRRWSRSPRAGHRLSGVEADRAGEQSHQRAEGQSRAGELPAEAVGQDAGEGPVPRHRARVRVRGRHDGGDPRRRDRAGQRHRGAQCRPGRRARHARNGDADDPAAGAGPRRGCRADHRRPLFRRVATAS